jgi:hypothetical protein
VKGSNGSAHTLLCQCNACVERRFEAFVERMEGFVKKTGARPTNASQTVMVKSFNVRAHWRRNPYHMNSDEGLKERVDGYFKRFKGER